MAKNKIYINMILFALIVISYISLLCFISNEGLKNPGALPRHGAIDAEMMNQSLPVQNADFNEIKINKNLIDIE